MHFSKTYSKLLLGLPPELTQHAIPYPQLKKLINAAVNEFASLELSVADSSVFPENELNASLAAGHVEDQHTFPILVYEFKSSSGCVERWSFPVKPTNLDVQGVRRKDKPLDDPNLSRTVGSSQPQSTMTSVACQDMSTAIARSSGLVSANLHLPAALGAQEAVITLAAEAAFYQLLSTTFLALAAHLMATYSEFSNTLHILSEDIVSCAKPRSSTSSFRPHSLSSDPTAIRVPNFTEDQTDLYAWREVFRLYVEFSPFERVSEANRGECTVEESEALLKSFTESMRQAVLTTDKPKMKLKRSRAALERFLELNMLILNVKKFQHLNVEATRKILKKHIKRIPLPLPQLSLLHCIASCSSRQSLSSKFAFLVPNSVSSLPRIMVQAISELLLTIIPPLDDYTCLICTSIAFKPIRLGCGHFFCVRCLVQMQKRNQANCPMCRAHTVLAANRTNMDWALVNFMQDWFPVEAKAKDQNNKREASEELIRDMGYDPERCTII